MLSICYRSVVDKPKIFVVSNFENRWMISVMIIIEDVSNDLESGGEKHFRERWLQYLKRPLSAAAACHKTLIYDFWGVSFIRRVSPYICIICSLTDEIVVVNFSVVRLLSLSLSFG